MDIGNKNMSLKRVGIFLASCFVLGTTAPPTTALGFTPSVSLCVEKTGLTEEECQEKMKNFGSMSSEEKKGMRNDVTENKSKNDTDVKDSENGAAKISDDAIAIRARIEKTQEIKINRERQFSQALEKIEKITELLKTRNIDVAEIEKNTDIFREKFSNMLGAYDEYDKLLKNGECGESLAICATERKKELIRIGELTGDLVNFYRETFRESLRAEIIKAQAGS